jgi:hypothetical protein
VEGNDKIVLMEDEFDISLVSGSNLKQLGLRG